MKMIYTCSFCLNLGKIVPFRVGVHFDGYEVCSAVATDDCEWDLAAASDPSGSFGFRLAYWQKSC